MKNITIIILVILLGSSVIAGCIATDNAYEKGLKKATTIQTTRILMPPGNQPRTHREWEELYRPQPKDIELRSELAKKEKEYDALLGRYEHAVWHYEMQAETLRDNNQLLRQQLIDAGVWEIDTEITFEYGILRSYERTKDTKELEYRGYFSIDGGGLEPSDNFTIEYEGYFDTK